MSLVGPNKSPRGRWEKASEKGTFSDAFLTLVPSVDGVTPADSMEDAVGLAYFALDQAPDAVQLISPEGHFLYVNEESCRELGYSREELLTMGVWDIDPDRTPEMFRKRFQMLKEQKAWTFETRHRRKNGTIFPVEISARYGTFGGQQYYFAFVRDISERKRAEKALQGSEQKYRDLYENLRDGWAQVDAHGRIVQSNEAFRQLTGYTAEELAPLTYEDLTPERWHEAERKILNEQVFARGYSDLYEKEYYRKDGSRVPIEVQTYRVPGEAFPSSWAFVRDITEHKRAEKELREREELFHSIVEHSHAGIYMIDDAFRFVYVNDLFCKITGYAREEIVGTDFRAILAEESARDVSEHYLRRQQGEQITDQYQIAIIRKDGEKRIAEMTVAVINDAGGKKRTVGQGLDITDRKRAEKALQDQFKFLEVLLESIPLPVFFKDMQGVYLGCNKAFEELLGLSRNQIIGRMVHDVFPGEGADRHQCSDLYLCEHPGIHAYEYEVADHKKQHRQFVITKAAYQDQEGKPAGLIGTIFEITEMKRLQVQLVQAQKMEAVGTLSAGVAHEINNPITGVINYAQILCDQAEEVGADAGIPLRIMKEAERVSRIVKSLLSFARESTAEVAPVEMGEIIEETLALTAAQLRKEGIRVLVEVEKGLPPIMANRPRIQQVLLNIVTNSRYALNKKYHGFHKDKVIEIRAEEVKQEGKPFLRTTIYDRGTGIPREVQSEVFNPFFSTKPVDEGTGLGLSISYGIVKDHRGSIQVESAEGQYTKMMVDLPVATHLREHATA